METSCESCLYYGGKCKKGQDAEIYCLADAKYGIKRFELWEPKEKEEYSIEKELDKIEVEENEIAEAQTAEVFEEEKKEEVFIGYNGIKAPFSQEIKSLSCEGCRNNSQMVGCFLNKYSDCVIKGRYLFEKAPDFIEEKIIKVKEEDKKEEEVSLYIDNLLDGIE